MAIRYPCRAHRRLCVTVALGVAATSLGCKLELFDSSPVPEEPELIPEVHGRYVASAGGNPITWSASGEEIAVGSADYRSAFAYHLQSGAVRQLYASEHIYDAALSADGVDWFTTSFQGTATMIRRHTSSGSTVLTDRGTTGAGAGLVQGSGVLVAPHQSGAAFIVRPDSLFFLRRGGGPTLLGSGCTGILTFSPDGSRVLCTVPGWPPSFQVFRLDGGVPEPLMLSPEVTSPRLIWWGQQGIQVLFGNTAAFLYDVGSGSSRPLPGVHLPLVPGTGAWSNHGKKVVYWNDYCAQSAGGLFSRECRVNQGLIYVLDTATGTTARIAVHTGSGSGQVAISPIGSTVAYTINRGLYLIELK